MDPMIAADILPLTIETNSLNPSMANTSLHDPIFPSKDNIQITPQADKFGEDAVLTDPLSTITSAPSSDDCPDDHQERSEDVANVVSSPHGHTANNIDIRSSHQQSTVLSDSTMTFNTAETAEERSIKDLSSTNVKEEQKSQDKVEDLSKMSDESSLKTSFDQGEELIDDKEQAQEEPRESLSRPLSRQELRRKSSFFNSKDIAVSDKRYGTWSGSSSISASMRPITDPRFKSRFQSLLSQWKAREGN
ncbi:hypothetical protein BX616_002697 [Lobosporangium transversale]|uniref:Uncharacterized protein n=1 Tax=Lobosporangium transversale TaxID=64571 RepID=A0A1Y2GLI4_9FUNG|nr:hypothetical protein BCR41DRAFT_354168 [Lobosporangium transversale]KAF9919033.1 hypothetical protein BX616_002697 [Lobosporangium transversale]ORZ14824.1 hypothetical protein BCR41DRAFT_354168 [Lobosporangium transversale]|eukprot:XP_021880956.1 hypothetical protein BCR41DRAFT_354168 [Lobosporangium transversale]